MKQNKQTKKKGAVDNIKSEEMSWREKFRKCIFMGKNKGTG